MNTEILNQLNIAQLAKILIIAVGLMTIILSVLALIRGKYSKNWNKTEGEILKSEFIEFGSSGDSKEFLNLKSNTSMLFKVKNTFRKEYTLEVF